MPDFEEFLILYPAHISDLFEPRDGDIRKFIENLKFLSSVLSDSSTEVRQEIANCRQRLSENWIKHMRELVADLTENMQNKEGLSSDVYPSKWAPERLNCMRLLLRLAHSLPIPTLESDYLQKTAEDLLLYYDKLAHTKACEAMCLLEKVYHAHPGKIKEFHGMLWLPEVHNLSKLTDDYELPSCKDLATWWHIFFLNDLIESPMCEWKKYIEECIQGNTIMCSTLALYWFSMIAKIRTTDTPEKCKIERFLVEVRAIQQKTILETKLKKFNEIAKQIGIKELSIEQEALVRSSICAGEQSTPRSNLNNASNHILAGTQPPRKRLRIAESANDLGLDANSTGAVASR